MTDEKWTTCFLEILPPQQAPISDMAGRTGRNWISDKRSSDRGALGVHVAISNDHPRHSH